MWRWVMCSPIIILNKTSVAKALVIIIHSLKPILVSQSNSKKKLTIDQCSELEVIHEKSSVEIIKKDRLVKNLANWGEEFVISLDFEAFKVPPLVTNILHITTGHDYDYDYDYEPETDGRRIPGCRTFQPWTFQPKTSTPNLSNLDFSTINSSTMSFSPMKFSTLNFNNQFG